MQTNLYPSTSDVSPFPPIAGGQDEVLITLQRGLKRVKRSWTDGAYIGSDGAVCAVGSVIAADRKTRHYNRIEGNLSIEEFVERELSDIAKEAISVLDEAAMELYPEESESYDWPIEGVNQLLGKDAVIECYEKAIESRQLVTA